MDTQQGSYQWSQRRHSMLHHQDYAISFVEYTCMLNTLHYLYNEGAMLLQIHCSNQLALIIATCTCASVAYRVIVYVSVSTIVTSNSILQTTVS
jgi:hypothetical protein